MKSGKLSKMLGADRILGTIQVTVFVPTVDREGAKLRKNWTRESLSVLGRIFGGATAYPRGMGVWRDDERAGRLVFDETAVVFCYIAVSDFTGANLGILRTFLNKMGREGNQGEIGLVIAGKYYRIRKFDKARK